MGVFYFFGISLLYFVQPCVRIEWGMAVDKMRVAQGKHWRKIFTRIPNYQTTGAAEGLLEGGVGRKKVGRNCFSSVAFFQNKTVAQGTLGWLNPGQ